MQQKRGQSWATPREGWVFPRDSETSIPRDSETIP